LHTWLSKKMIEGGEVAESACKMVEGNLIKIISFINSRGLLHFDAHFYNILTDGNGLYFSDFGLATCEQFELSKTELDFFKKHCNYDQCYAMAYFVEWLLTTSFGIENWVIGNDNAALQEYATGQRRILSPVIESIVMQYLPITVLMNDFFIKLKESKTKIYPASEIDYACIAANLIIN
jgi:hypothetical protein